MLIGASTIALRHSQFLTVEKPEDCMRARQGDHTTPVNEFSVPPDMWIAGHGES
jgi:hypothetical protein